MLSIPTSTQLYAEHTEEVKFKKKKMEVRVARCDSCFPWDRERNKHQIDAVAAIPGENKNGSCSLASGSFKGAREKKMQEHGSQGELKGEGK